MQPISSFFYFFRILGPKLGYKDRIRPQPVFGQTANAACNTEWQEI